MLKQTTLLLSSAIMGFISDTTDQSPSAARYVAVVPLTYPMTAVSAMNQFRNLAGASLPSDAEAMRINSELEFDSWAWASHDTQSGKLKNAVCLAADTAAGTPKTMMDTLPSPFGRMPNTKAIGDMLAKTNGVVSCMGWPGADPDTNLQTVQHKYYPRASSYRWTVQTMERLSQANPHENSLPTANSSESSRWKQPISFVLFVPPESAPVDRFSDESRAALKTFVEELPEALEAAGTDSTLFSVLEWNDKEGLATHMAKLHRAIDASPHAAHRDNIMGEERAATIVDIETKLAGGTVQPRQSKIRAITQKRAHHKSQLKKKDKHLKLGKENLKKNDNGLLFRLKRFFMSTSTSPQTAAA